MRIVLLMFILLPVIEMLVLIEVGSQVGGLVTIALVLLTALVGLSLIRKQGASTMLRAKDKIQQGSLPAKEILETVVLGVAGVLLFLPGFVTDLIGFLLIFPFSRKLFVSLVLIKFVASKVNVNATWQTTANKSEGGEIIEGEFVNEDRDLLKKK